MGRAVVLAALAAIGSPAQSQNASRPAFEVASVKPSISGPGVLNPNRGNLIAENVSLKELISSAYGIPEVQISGPGWMADQQFNIHAKKPESAPESAWKPMLQTLLEDRFHLEAHRETREGAVYFLVLAASALKAPALDPAKPLPPTRPVPGSPSMLSINGPISQFADRLSKIVGHPVVDRTGIQGRYHIVLAYDARAEAEGPNVFSALREQLGLKLESGKGPVEVLVVDHVDKVPREN